MATVDRPEEQVRSSVEILTQRAVRLYRIRALLWAIGLVFVATIGFVGLDYSLHVEERGWRWLLSISWLLTIVGIGWRWLPDATSFRLTPIQVAQWIERRRPELGDKLSRLLAVHDLPDTDPRFGSIEFRRAASTSCDVTLAQLPWQSFVDRQPTLAAGWFCSVSLITASLLALIAGPIAGQGITRIVRPWSWAPWPRSEQLQLVDPPRMIARDSDLEVRVVDLQPPFPETVELELRVDAVTNRTANLRLPMRLMPELAVVTLPSMENDFSIRPIGGDQQDGPWHAIRVARQPQLKEYAFTIQSPDYVKQAATELVGQRIDVLAGSRVTLRGKFDERLKSLRAVGAVDNKLKAAIASSAITAPVQEWHAILGSDGLTFELFTDNDASMVSEDRRWQFEIETAEGLRLTDTKQWMIHVTTDRPPAVTLAPIEPRAITRNATLNILGSASDDLGLVEVELTWHLPNQPPQCKRLWPNGSDDAVNDTTPSSLRSAEVSSLWSVAAASLSVGQSITVELVARDSAGQTGKSVPQTLEVLDDSTALAYLQRQQAETFGPLRQLLDAQRRNQQSLNRNLDITRQLDAVGREQVDAVAGAQQLGQSIAGSLLRNQDSLVRQLQQLSDQLSRNQLGETPLAGDVARLRSQIEALVNEQLSPALKELDSAHQAMREASEGSSREQAVNLLAKATQLNQKASDQFSDLVESVAAAESLAEFQKQIQELSSDQSAVAKQTERLQVDTVLRGSSTQVEAARAGIQSDQQSLARRVEELAGRLAKELQPSEGNAVDPASRKAIEKAHAKLIERRIADQMRSSADRVKENQLTDALATQQQVEQLLDEVAAELGGGNAGGLESSSESMQGLATQLNKLAGEQQQTAEALKQAASSANANAKRQLAARQQELRDEINQLNEEPSVQANQRLHDTLADADNSIEQAIEQTEQGKFQEAEQNAREAAESLKAAAQSAQQRAEQLQSQVAQQQMLDLKNLLSTAVKRQQPVVTSLEQAQGKAQDPTLKIAPPNLGELLTTEQQLQQQLLQGRQRLQSLDVFDWLLGQCDEELLRTIASLERQRTDTETLASAKAALDMMRAAEAAVTEAAQPDASSAEGNASELPKQSSDQASQLPTLASLRLLRQMQTLINQQSEQMLSDPAKVADSALSRMADRQQALAEQVARLREQLKQRN